MNRQTARGLVLMALFVAGVFVVSQTLGAVLSGDAETMILTLAGGILGLTLALPGLLMLDEGMRVDR